MLCRVNTRCHPYGGDPESYLKMRAASAESSQKPRGSKPVTRAVLFPACVLVVYGMLLAITPDKAFEALKSSGNVSLNIVQPLGLVFAVMLVLNLFVKPAQIARFLGRGAGIKGTLISVVAGIISTGPIYAWYPLLKELREKGAGSFPLAVFMYNRAVKPFLLPIMVAYFGWRYVVILTVLTVLASIAVGYSLGVLMKEEDSP